MQYCLQLARLGEGYVAPNPMVGSILVYDDRIIGAGYHKQFGQAHAEVNCINSVATADQKYIALSTLYVSLEPCAHFGKTPPCANFIVQHQIPKVVIGCTDSFDSVNGKGIKILKQAGVKVQLGILEAACKELNKPFFAFHKQKRPFVTLKWANTANGFIGHSHSERLLISNQVVNRWVHSLRNSHAAILVGTNTALIDNPQLTNRWWTGKQPVRLVVDKQLTLPTNLHLFNKACTTVVFNYLRHDMHPDNALRYWQLQPDKPFLQQLLQACHQMQLQSVLVEGGAMLLQSFIDEGLWNEAIVITNTQLSIPTGIAAPKLQQAQLIKTNHLSGQLVHTYEPTANY